MVYHLVVVVTIRDIQQQSFVATNCTFAAAAKTILQLQTRILQKRQLHSCRTAIMVCTFAATKITLLQEKKKHKKNLSKTCSKFLGAKAICAVNTSRLLFCPATNTGDKFVASKLIFPSYKTAACFCSYKSSFLFIYFFNRCGGCEELPRQTWTLQGQIYVQLQLAICGSQIAFDSLGDPTAESFSNTIVFFCHSREFFNNTIVSLSQQRLFK